LFYIARKLYEFAEMVEELKKLKKFFVSWSGNKEIYLNNWF